MDSDWCGASLGRMAGKRLIHQSLQDNRRFVVSYRQYYFSNPISSNARSFLSRKSRASDTMIPASSGVNCCINMVIYRLPFVLWHESVHGLRSLRSSPSCNQMIEKSLKKMNPAIPHPTQGQTEPVSGSAHVSGKAWTYNVADRVHIPAPTVYLRRRILVSGTIHCPPLNVAGKTHLLFIMGIKSRGRPPGCKIFFECKKGKTVIICGRCAIPK